MAEKPVDTIRLPRTFVARTLRFAELPANSIGAECSQADYDRFVIVHNPRAMEVLAEELGLTEAVIRRGLAVTSVDRNVVAGFEWARLLSDVLAREYLQACDLELPGSNGLRKILYPFLNVARAQIDSLQIGHSCAWELLSRTLILQFSDLLTDIALKALLLEATILKQFRPETAGRETTEFGQNFAEYCSGSIRYVQKFYLRYAALSRLLAVATLQWQRNTAQLLSRLDADRPAIGTAVFGSDFGLLSGVEGTLSDSHDGGQTVLFLTFDCGRRLVYKPRSLHIDTVFADLVERLAQAGVEPQLRAMRIVAREEYGWMEVVHHRPIDSLTEARDFYFRQGTNLALLYLLRGTDLHSENVIAEGAQPILVDLEALLHPRPRRSADTPPPAPAEEWLGRSVFVSGLLPGWQRGGEDRDPDLSGLGGGQEREFYRREGDVVRKDASGNLRIVKDKIPVPDRENRLLLDGEVVRPLAFVDDLVAGFAAAYDALRGPARAAAPDLVQPNIQVRYIALDTATYGQALRRSLHPDFLHRAAHRELVAASLAYRAPFVPWFRRLLAAEIDAVFDGDIPKFTARAGSLDLADHRGRPITDYLAQTAVAMLADRIEALSADQRDQQTQLIRLAMATLVKVGEAPARTHPPIAPQGGDLAADELLAEAAEIGEQICAEAIVERGEPDWITVTQGENGRSALAAAGLDIYDGAGGIGLFLHEIGRQTGSARMLETARDCGARLASAMGRDHYSTGGAYNGAASAAHALFRLGEASDEPEWRTRASEELGALRKSIENDSVFDLVAGSAGYVAVLLDVYRATGEPVLREAAIEVGELLLRKVVHADGGIALPPRRASQPLTGLSHGAAGLGFALLHLGAELGREDLVAAGHAAYDYEDALRDPAIGGYPDFREHRAGDPPWDSGAWCHGAPGIALSRIAMPAGLRRARDLATVAEHLRRDLALPLAPNDSLCHGELGNAEVLAAAAVLAGTPEQAALARRRIDTAVLRKREVGSWRCGATPHVFVPGAMIGLAGIGIGLLRACDPDGIRSLLVPCRA